MSVYYHLKSNQTIEHQTSIKSKLSSKIVQIFTLELFMHIRTPDINMTMISCSIENNGQFEKLKNKTLQGVASRFDI